MKVCTSKTGLGLLCSFPTDCSSVAVLLCMRVGSFICAVCFAIIYSSTLFSFGVSEKLCFVIVALPGYPPLRKHAYSIYERTENFTTKPGKFSDKKKF